MKGGDGGVEVEGKDEMAVSDEMRSEPTSAASNQPNTIQVTAPAISSYATVCLLHAIGYSLILLHKRRLAFV